MRADMAKVIVERPRYGSRARGAGKGYRKRFGKTAWVDQPTREGMKVRGGGTKSLNEHLAPLRRFLESQLGRPWDKVYAEICANVSRDSAVQDHVRDHVWDFVAVRVRLDGKTPCYADGYRAGAPLAQGWHRFYVCPRTGLLKRVAREGRKARDLRLFSPARNPMGHLLGRRLALVPIDAEHFLILVEGKWLRIRLERFAHGRGYDTLTAKLDTLLGTALTREQAVRSYGRAAVATEFRPATRDEVRRFAARHALPEVVR